MHSQGKVFLFFIHNQIIQRSLSRSDRKAQTRTFRQNRKWEITMRKAILTVVSASVIATLTAQAAAASEHRHTRTKGRTVASEQWRNSNAYAAPHDIALPSYSSTLDEGAMSSGMAGR
jgi:hypothetical protein